MGNFFYVKSFDVFVLCMFLFYNVDNISCK
jgi:hypothetical protein